MRVLFKTDYNQDIRIAKHSGYLFWYSLLFAAVLVAPFVLDTYWINELTRVLIFALAGLGLMVVTGFTGQVSLGHAAFMAIGAYAQTYLLSNGVPFFLSLPMAALISGIVGLLIAVPASRMTGLYLTIASLAFAIVVEDMVIHWESVTGGNRGMVVDPPVVFGYEIFEAWEYYYIVLVLLIISIVLVLNVLRSPLGRSMLAVRDSEISAESLGIRVARTKVLAFMISAALTGLAGGLFAHFIQFLSPEIFGIILSIQLLLMIVVGGLGTVHGAIFGAILIGFLEASISILKDWLPAAIGNQPGLEPGLFGLILVLFIIFEPEGVYGRWVKFRTFLESFPFYRRNTFKRQRSYLKTERMR
ncbi:MAG: branched-chain amino acid ABC transporter permease [Parvibaculales bacterium]